MTAKTVSIFDGVPRIEAVQLEGRKVTLTITRVEQVEIVGESGRKTPGFEVSFKETSKKVAFACKANRRALYQIFGTEDYTKYAGGRVVLYAVQTSRGLGIRFSKAE
jgi:hypothetical protein